MVRLTNLIIPAVMPFTASAFSASDVSVTRRDAFAKTASTLIGGTVAGGLVGVPSAGAVVTDETPKVISRMGGLLVGPKFYNRCVCPKYSIFQFTDYTCCFDNSQFAGAVSRSSRMANPCTLWLE